ncbi:ABC transporter ATP-binding protein [Clostridium hydrogeniformans]|uniref:ABC transporter ATP-binding protein n=1 Tax=Clostridium hydrogeniformans TaxID=349933 RepID=UPI00047F87E0|nr:ABC transporter ATP-binding protein [Clostridium hydrogeniformans]
MNTFYVYIKRYYKLFLVAIFSLMIEIFCDLMQPTIMSKVVDIGVKNKDINYVINMGGVMVLVTLIGALGATGRNILSSTVSQSFASDLRGDLFKKINSFSFKTLDNFTTPSLVTRLTNDVTQVQNFVNGLMRIFVKAPLIGIGAIIMASRLNPPMAIILIIILPIIILIIFMNMRISYPFFIKIQGAVDRVNGIMREYLGGVRVVKAFNRFNYEKHRFENSNEELTKLSKTAMMVNSLFSPGITLTVNLFIVVVLWVGGNRVNNGTMEVGQVIAFTNYMTQILFSLMMISHVFTMFIKAKASTKRIGEVLREDSDDVRKESGNSLDLQGNVEFKDVSFSYFNNLEDLVLKNISFKAKAKETIGIIGSTGSGKSTLVNLIPGFYNTNLGHIEIDGVNIKNINYKSLRDSIAIVPQKTVLFTGTIKDNILWGKENADFEDIKEAASVAMAHDFIVNTKDGYDTILGKGGVNLSGGQKQRVSIARALIKKPKILILDDCTSALDTLTETKIREGLKTYLGEVTTFIISQKVTSVIEADKIIVIDNGEIVGIGTHKDLVESCDVYNEILNSQLGEEEWK